MNLFKRRRPGGWLSLVLNILGMTAAFSALYIMFVQVYHDFDYNHGIKDADRIYIVSLPDWFQDGKYMVNISRPPIEYLINNLTEIECGGVGDIKAGRTYISLSQDSAPSIPVQSTSLSIGAAKALGLTLVSGSWDAFLPTDTRSLALSESEAARLGLQVGDRFYSADEGNSNVPANIIAIYKDAPRNTDLATFQAFSLYGDSNIDDWSEWSYHYFVKARKGVSRGELEAAMLGGMKKLMLDEGVSEEQMDEVVKQFSYHLVPLTESYFSQDIASPQWATGDKVTAVTLLAVAILVIVIAFINFINFFFALVPVRLRSVNTRRVLGASRGSLVWSSVLDSIKMIAVSLVLAAAVVLLFQGTRLTSLISCSTAFGDNVGVALFTVALAFVLAVAASLYPAFYITSFSPALALKGSMGSSKKGQAFRYALVGLQFFISMSLIICACFISLQRRYMMRYDMGFNRENLLTVSVSNAVGKSTSTVESRLLDDPRVKDVTWADGDVVRASRMGWGREFKGENISFNCYPVAWNFLQFMGIPVVEGRDFTDADTRNEVGTFIFNESAKKKFGLTLEDKIYGHNGDSEIVGFCRDFNFVSLKNDIGPLALYVFGKNPWRTFRTLIVRTEKNVDVKAVSDFIAQVVSEADPQYSVSDIDVRFFDQQIEKQYRNEERTSTLVTIFTVLAVLISLLGVFGLVMFETEHRRKEIGIRRVNGASVSGILKMFCAEFVRIVLICFVLAAPVSYLVVERYLSGFAFRVPIYAWVFALSLLATLVVTIAVVVVRSFGAATANPSEVLRKGE